MKGGIEFLKTTLIGGLIFLVPVVVLFIIIGKAIQIMMVVARPLDRLIPIESIGGIALANILAVLVLVFLCLIAGLVARSTFGNKLFHALENTFMKLVPGYAFVKGLSDSMASGEEAAESFVPVIAKLDDNAQIGFEIERTSSGNVVVYLPGAPNPWSGTVTYFTPDRVEQLPITISEAITQLRQLGRGSGVYGERSIKTSDEETKKT